MFEVVEQQSSSLITDRIVLLIFGMTHDRYVMFVCIELRGSKELFKKCNDYVISFVTMFEILGT